MAVFTRVALTAFPGIMPQWQQIVVFVSIASMALGSFAAIGQKNIKRLMAYSSIGHMGFALVGLAAGTAEGAQGVLVYVSIYVAMTLGTFSRDPGDEAQRPARRKDQRFRRPFPHQSDARLLLCDAVVFAGRRSAARRLLRQILCVRRGDQGRSVHAVGDRRADQRDRRLLLPLDCQGDVFRRAADPARSGARGVACRAGGCRVCSISFSLFIPDRW